MLQRLLRSRPRTVEFCDACAGVCDAGCRADTLRAQARDRAIAIRMGLQ